jgi:hypothetical protein
MALSATFENDFKQLEKVNRLVAAEMDDRHRAIDCHVISPSEDPGLIRMIRYEPEVSRKLIELGYSDAKRSMGG